MHKVCLWTVAVGRCKEESVTPHVISGFHCGINGIFAAWQPRRVKILC